MQAPLAMRARFSLTACAAVLASSAAFAQPEVTLSTPPPPVARTGAYTHDGFYLRLATGLSVMSEDLRSADSSVYGGEVKGESTGFATVSELAVGGTLGRGFVLGGGVYTAELISATFRTAKDSAGSPPAELDPEKRNFTLVGPFFDWYLREHKGFHIQAALGFCTFSAVRFASLPFEENDPYHAEGGGIMLGAGYEWWIARQWSMGVMARLTAAYLTGKDDAGVRWYHALGTSPSPMFTVTYQ